MTLRVASAVIAGAIVAATLLAACSPPRPPLPDGPTVRVDAEGFFASEGPVPGAWHAGEGVALLVPRVPGGLLTGRLESSARSATVLAAKGGFAPHALGTESSRAPLSGVVRAALAKACDAAPGRLAPLVVQELRDPAPFFAASASGFDPSAVWHRAADLGCVRADAPPTEGAPLAAWGPRHMPFVWLRSVEAGYRLSSVLDGVAARVLAAGGDARDAATLRLTLHDLLLPTIWRANPSGEKGVGECAVVLAPPLTRGRLRAAVIFRVLDPVLHDMETRAGIALESRPDHRWRPADDPFPARRARRNERRRVADVEIVATDRLLAEALAAGVQGTHAEDPAAMAFLTGPGAGPGRRALVAVFPPDTLTAYDAGLDARLAEGVTALLRRHWPDAAARVAAGPLTPLGLHRVEVRTDAEGAFVRLDTGSEASAARWAAVLAAPPDADSLAAACAANAADLAVLAALDGVRRDPVERALVVLGFRPVCPAGGAYRAHPITRAVACSVHGSPTAPRAVGAPGGPPVTKVTSKGAEVSLRVTIDWRRKE